MNVGEQAFYLLYDKMPERRIVVKYSSKFTAYNANVKMNTREILFSLSRKFEHLENEIKIGVIQHLLNKLFKTKINTDEQELYNNFLKRMSDYAPVTEVDMLLAESFSRVNEEYFHGMMSRPNLIWGRRNNHLLGTYTYGTDTIMISSVLANAPEELLDYVMYHEMLHKKHKFSCSSGRTHSHTPAFKRDEAKYSLPNAERELTRWLRGSRTPESSLLKKVMRWV